MTRRSLPNAILTEDRSAGLTKDAAVIPQRILCVMVIGQRSLTQDQSAVASIAVFFRHLFRLSISSILVGIFVLAGVSSVASLVPAKQDLPAESPSPSFATDQVEFFENKIRPLLVEHCFPCHSQQTNEVMGGLYLDSRQGLLAGGDSGPAIDLNSPANSLLLEAIRYGDLFQMPPTSKLADEKIELFEKWIEMGAPWGLEAGTHAVKQADFNLAQRKAGHWCWHPPLQISVPSASDDKWNQHVIDCFLFNRLKQEKLVPNPPASRNVLIRRAYFDLIGLPPTPKQVQAFVDDPEPNAFEKVIDQLLASPHFGERWARHWMDLVRYAETYGHEFDFPIKHAYQYRDYLIRAFNADVPYDQFVIEHIAGDLLNEPRLNPEDLTNESIRGTGFWFFGEAVQAPVDVRADEAGRIDNQIDVLTKTFLGLTVACSRCHDHKFDAISTADYYALCGILQSSRRQDVLLDPHQTIATKRAQIAELVAECDQRANGILTNFRQVDPQEFARHLRAAVEFLSADPSWLDLEKRDKLLGPANEPVMSVETEQNNEKLLDVAQLHRIDPAVLRTWTAALLAEETNEITHPLNLIRELVTCMAKSQKPNFGTGFKEAQQLLQKRQQDAINSRANATQFADFSSDNDHQWFETGFAFGKSIQPVIADTVGHQLLLRSDVAHSGRFGFRQFGVLRSPTFDIEHSQVHYRMASTGVQIRLIVDGFELDVQHSLLFNGMSFQHDSQGKTVWRTQSEDLKNYLGHRAHIEIIDHGDGWAAVDEIWFSNEAAPKDFPSPLAAGLTNKSFETLDELCTGFAESLLRPDAKPDDLVQLMNWMGNHDLKTIRTSEEGQRLGVLKQQIADLQAELPAPKMAIGITDGSPENEFLFIRGNHRNLGAEVPRDMIAALKNDSKLPLHQFSGSGRLEFAKQIASPNNPLTSRVMVNRVWHHLFGRGLVTTVDNFGVLGERPTHPELLDFLAIEFARDGWSIKRLAKRIMLSQAYQMASSIQPANEEIDPANRWYHRGLLRRLQGEAIRDAMLVVSGDFDPSLYGPSVPVHLTAFMEGRGRPGESGPLNGKGRRSLYTEVRRNFLPPMMLAFDTPIPFNTIGRRTESNVPAQALILMNSPFVVDQANKWAVRLMNEQPDSRRRIEQAYRQAFSRNPSAMEIGQGLEFLSLQARERNLDPKQLAEHQELWADYCHVLLNVKELIYIR